MSDPDHSLVEELQAQVDDGVTILAELRHQAATVEMWAERIVESAGAGGKVLVFGNGGSAADAQHLASELVGRFRVEDRPPLAAIALTTDSSVLTSLANDFGFASVFARQVSALARPGDVVVAISTSGRSENVREGLAAAREAGCDTLGLLGSGERLDDLVASAITFGATDSGLVQQAHGAAIHLLCHAVEQRWADGEAGTATDPRRDLAAVVARRERWRRLGLRVVTTNGCFDLLHAGHLATLTEAAAQGDRLVVLVNSDEAVRRLKGPDRPLTPADDRARLLAALRMVDAVVLFDDDTPEAVLAELAPDVHCKGGDYSLDRVVEAAVVEAHGGRVHLTALVDGVSTSALLADDRK